MDDILNEILNQDFNFSLEQPLISKKKNIDGYSVERNYINSKEYHDKFQKLPVNKNVQEALFEDYIDDSELVINKDNKIEAKYAELIKEQNDFLNALVEKGKQHKIKNKL